MADLSPTRPTRRAAQRSRIIDSPDENEHVHVKPEPVSDEENFAPTTRKPTQRTSRRRPNASLEAAVEHDAEDAITELRKVTKPRRNVRASRRSQSAVEFSQPVSLPTPKPSTTPEPIAQRAIEPEGEQDIPEEHNPAIATETPLKVDQGPELGLKSPGGVRSPLTDKSDADLNAQPAHILEDKPSTSLPPPTSNIAIEKPMDIVIRARAKAVPVPLGPAEATPRTVITYLVLTNFKSYAGRQEVGPFHASFSSVVGPNGSGKSNVIDSLLFVFGFRASKMRQGKISALIHNSAAFPDLDFCEVEVHFQEVIDRPGGKQDVVSNSQTVISRKVFKNNSSKYYINGRESTFTIVTALLRDRGVDLDHKRFLILQGEVESIAQMKPKAANEHDDGLLEYLEDIIGTSKYKSPIEESVNEVETLNEVCVEKNTRVAHVEKEKKGLEAKKDAALAYIKDENDLAVKQAALYQIFVAECEDNIQVTNEAVQQLQTNLENETAKHSSGEHEIKALQKNYTAELKQFEKLEQSTQATLRQLAKADKEAVKFDERRKHLNTKVKKLEKSAASAHSGISEATAYLVRLTDDIDRSASEVSCIETQLHSEEQELARIRDNLKDKTQGLSDQVNEKQRLLEPWTQRISEQASAVALARSELAMLKDRGNAGADALREAREKLEQQKADRVAKCQELDGYRSETASLEKEQRRFQDEIKKLQLSEPDKRSRLSAARQKADEARSSLAKSQTQGNVLVALKRLRDSGRITGFHGRLGDLGTIDSKYDVAISTACPSLDNLVVDSVDVGQQCIEHLRKNNLGRANFILLDRLGQRDVATVQTPENVPRLFDLIRSKDERFLPAFYNVLQNTLVADTLEQANRIAYGARRWRVVTLDGQLIDKSGTMSGGGTRVAKGAMSSKLVADVTAEQVAHLEKDIEQVERIFEELQSTQQVTTKALQVINERVPELETKSQRCSLEIGSIDRTIADAERRCKELSSTKNTSSADASKITELESMIARSEKEMEKLGSSASSIQAEIQALQDQIMEVGGIKLRGQKAKVDGLRDQINALTEEISNYQVNVSKTEKQKIKHDKVAMDSERDLVLVASEMQKLDDEAREHSSDAAGSKRQAEETQEALDSKREAIEALKLLVEEKTAELQAAQSVELELRNQLEDHRKVLADNEKRLKYWQEKLGKLALQNINDLGEELEQPDLATYSRDELADLDKTVLKGEIAVLEEKTQNVNVELGVLAEYRRRVEEHAQRSTDLAEALASRDAARKRCEELRRLRLEGFMEGFSTISLRLKEMYQMITMGGNAELELVDSLDPFSEGILFSVMPPKKSWKNISNLSGGEKTLSSLALVFALHHYKPTPLYVMDEIDAALDFRNVSIVASYIKERTKNAQFIVISLRNNMFELASRLVGVYKVNHMTKSVTVENRDYIVRAP